ncbi:hypothetical protein [Streptomyces chartreusis]
MSREDALSEAFAEMISEDLLPAGEFLSDIATSDTFTGGGGWVV